MTINAAARSARLLAQAKINLSLRVLARGNDGFHQIETIFQRLSLADNVALTLTASARSLDMDGADSVPVERNLAWRAALAYERRAHWPAGWRIEILKRIPMGGGLGGGSADAGAVLRILDRLNPEPLGAAALLRIAGELGADVPFLTARAPIALGWGRGERLLALPPLPVRPVALRLFPFGVSTGEAFAWLAESRGMEAGGAAVGGMLVPRARLLDLASVGSWSAVRELAVNDLEPVVFQRYPELGAGLSELASWLSESESASQIDPPGGGGERDPGVEEGDRREQRRVLARMTGTGSTLFAIPVDGPLPSTSLLRATGPAGSRLKLAETAGRVEEVELIE